MRLSGEVAEVADQRVRTLDAFNSDMKALTAHQRVVLALDTAERLVYGMAQTTTPETQMAESWHWLLQSLTQWGNVALLLAGRPDETQPLRHQLNETLNRAAIEIPVEGFSEEESLAYFNEVAQVAQAEGNHEVASRVAQLPPEARRLAHLYARGKPILLALLIDHLSVAEQVPDLLRTPFDEALRKMKSDPDRVQAQLEEQLVQRLVETRQFGYTFLALGRLAKGTNAELLAKILDISPDETQARLNEVRRLSFVKVRPADERVFLHDEMYALLQRWVYDNPHDAAERDRVAKLVQDYYDEQVARVRQDLDKLYAPVEVGGKDRLDLPRLAEVHARQQALQTELVYYRLRHEPVRGFQRYYRYTREAILSGNTSFYVQLQAEMLAFLAEQDRNGKGRASLLNGLERDVVLGEMALQPVMRAWAGGEYEGALAAANALRQSGARRAAIRTPINEAALNAWEAYALIYLGGEANLNLAWQKLDVAIESLSASTASTTREMSEAQLWRARAALAFAYRVRGYLKRSRGFMQGAVGDYSLATALWREVNVQIELATALNDMGFAMAELGYWTDARALVNEAFEIRTRFGYRSLAGLSRNTLALIDLREGNYITAIERAERALLLFRALGDERGVGLALIALAEAQRRYSGTPLVPDLEVKVDYLREARDYAREALAIFERRGETIRQVETLIEEGCACRDWVRVRRERPSPRDNIERLITEGDHALRRAAKLAGAAILYRQVDALVNLAWLGFFGGRDDLLDEAARAAEAAIPAEYRINKGSGKPDVPMDQAQVLLWPQLGKLHTLYGHQAHARYLEAKRTSGTGLLASPLLDVAHHYTLGLEYSALYGEDYRDIRRAKDEIHDRLKSLQRDFGFKEVKTIARQVNEVEREFNLRESVMRRFLKRRALWYGD
jgi:hypothetical protein